MANTTNFGWETPDDTDLVKDGAAAMRTLGNSIDASFVDLKGGTTGQILSKNSNTDLDYIWINNDQGDITAVTAGTGISGGGTSGAVTITNSMATEITASGDIIVGTGSGTFDNLPIGTTGQVLTADTTVSPYKVKWATPSAGLTKITAGSFSAVSSVTIDNVFNSTYTRYVMQLKATGNTLGADLELQMRYGSSTQTTAYYGSGNVLERTNTSVNFGYQNTGAGTLVNTLTSNGSSNLEIFFDRVGQSSELFAMWGTGYSEYENAALQFAGSNGQDRTYTGVIIKCSSGTITGTYKIYGLEN